MSLRIVKVLSVVCILALFLAIGLGFFLKSKYVGPVLMYHYVLDSQKAKKDRRIVTPNSLESQLNFLKTNNYNVIPLEEFATLVREKKDIPNNTVVLTFDDGHLDNYTNAYPILKKYGLPATMFIIVEDLSTPGSVTKDQIREMSDSGLITIGSHALHGEHLPSMSDESELKKEIYDSKESLEKILGKPVNCFSYPIGGFTEKIREMVINAGYTAAVATSPGVDYPDDDVFAIKRVRISESSKNLFIFWFASSGLYRYILSARKKFKG
ncbi:polysaccharide deacetylase family protein [Thermoproteota archaeon]